MTGILHEIGMKYGTDKATFHGYLPFYEDQLPTREFAGRLLEIGVMDGASLKMWLEYYQHAEIVGIDNSRWPQVIGADIVRADATDPDDVEYLIDDYGPFDVIIDDGSHMTADQQKSFELLWSAVKPGGVYVIEDLHTSYMSNYINSRFTTIDYLARQDLPVTWWRGTGIPPDEFLGRHGFPDGGIEWVGPKLACSITAVIRKES